MATDTKQIAVHIPADLHAWLLAARWDHRTTVTALVIRALEELRDSQPTTT